MTAYSVYWAERVKVCRRMSCSPYLSTTGTHPSYHSTSYDSLHHTEFSQSLDILTADSFLNQTHPSVSLTIMMMMAALPRLNKYCKSSFCSLLNFRSKLSSTFPRHDFIYNWSHLSTCSCTTKKDYLILPHIFWVEWYEWLAR